MSAQQTITVGQLARACSGPLGDDATIGVVAHTQAGYDFLRAELTAARVKVHFAALPVADVHRYELPRVRALNFVLANALASDSGPSLRFDTDGRLLGAAMAELALPTRGATTRLCST